MYSNVCAAAAALMLALHQTSVPIGGCALNLFAKKYPSI